MKILVALIGIASSLASIGASIPGLPVTGPVVPTDTTDTFPSHLALYGRGGLRTVETNVERDAIPTARREVGMLVHTSSTGRTWKLREDLLTWMEVDTSQRLLAWDPELEESIAVDRGSDGAITKYVHDTAAIFYAGEWWYAWNGNVTQAEGVPGQKNMQRRWSDWRTIRNAPITTPWESASESENPINPLSCSWHPNYWVNPSSGALENWWFASAHSTATNQGYRSTWNTNTARWTNFKLQLQAGGSVTWSTNVLAYDSADRLSLFGRSYTPMPLALPATRGGGVWANPVILANTTNISLNGSFDVAVLRSSDNGATWSWSIGPTNSDAAVYRTTIWEPFMTWDGSLWRLFVRNFNPSPAVPIGKSYSVAQSSDLITWTPWRDAGIEVTPLRWQTQPDGTSWLAVAPDRSATAAGTEPTRRLSSSLWRSRDGLNWSPLGLVTRDFGPSAYSTAIFPGDGYGYVYGTRGHCAVLSRFRPPPSGLVATPRNNAAQGLDKGATMSRDGNAVLLRSRDYLRKRFSSFHTNTGWSVAIAGVPGSVAWGLGVSTTRTNTAVYGNGHNFLMDGGWLPRFGVTDLFGAIRWRGFEPTFVGVSFDDTDKRLRVAVRNSEGYQQEEYHGVAIFNNSTITNGLSITLDGVTYTFRDSPSVATDVLRDGASMLNTLINWRLVIQTNSPSLIVPAISQWRVDGTFRSALLALKAAPTAANPFGTITLDGVIMRQPTNIWPELADGVTLNGNNNGDARLGTGSGAEIWEFGVWTNRLSISDFQQLSNEIGARWGWRALQTTNATSVSWLTEHHGFSGARGVDPSWEGYESRSHDGTWDGETMSLPGDSSAAIETPVGDAGNWTFRASARWDRFPAGTGFPLLVVGSHETNSVVNVTNISGTVTAVLGGQSVVLPSDSWAEFTVRRSQTNVTFSAGGSVLTQTISTPSRLYLGRGVYQWIGFEVPKRAANQSTQFRSLRFD